MVEECRSPSRCCRRAGQLCGTMERKCPYRGGTTSSLRQFSLIGPMLLMGFILLGEPLLSVAPAVSTFLAAACWPSVGASGADALSISHPLSISKPRRLSGKVSISPLTDTSGGEYASLIFGGVFLLLVRCGRGGGLGEDSIFNHASLNHYQFDAHGSKTS